MKHFFLIALFSFFFFTACEEDSVRSEMKDVETAGDEAVKETEEAIEAFEEIEVSSSPSDVAVAEALAEEAEAAVEVLEAEARQTAEALEKAVSEAKARTEGGSASGNLPDNATDANTVFENQ